MSTVIPDSVRGVLRCGDCNDLLSCGPVLLIHDTSAVICGRCSSLHQQEEEQVKKEDEASNSLKSSRILQYEALAGLYSFPCKFVDRGCQVIMEFSPEEPNTHEGDCPFRPLLCPIIGSQLCDWIGTSQSLQDHVVIQHADHLFSNPCSLPRPDITKSYLQNFLVTAYNLMFLIQLKVCVTSGKLFHCVRMLGDSIFLDKFTFELKISGKNFNVSKKGSVLRAGVLALQKPTALCTNINSLLEDLGGEYDQAECQLTINTSLNINCLNCLKHIISESKFCGECQENLVKCVFSANGCFYMDVNKDKLWKHEYIFCKYQRKCFECCLDLVATPFIEHLNSPTSHYSIISKLNSVFRATKTSSEDNYVLFPMNNCENILCEYYLNDSFIQFCLYSSMIYNKLKKLKCLIKITDPQTKHTEIKTLQSRDNDVDDWYIKVNVTSFLSWEIIGLDIEINIE